MEMINSDVVSIPRLSYLFQDLKLAKVGVPYPFKNPDTNIETITTKIMVVSTNPESIIQEQTEITISGTVKVEDFTIGESVDVLGCILAYRSGAKKGFNNQDPKSWLEKSWKADRLIKVKAENSTEKAAKQEQHK